MLRRLLFAGLALACFAMPAAAQMQCAPVAVESFVADAVADPKAQVLQGAQAAAFGEAAGITAEVVAAILVKIDEGTELQVVVMRGPTGAAACFGPATGATKALFLRIVGQPT